MMSSPRPPTKVSSLAVAVMVSWPAPPSSRSMPISVVVLKSSVFAESSPEMMTPIRPFASIVSTSFWYALRPIVVASSVAITRSLPVPPLRVSKPSFKAILKISSPSPPSSVSSPGPPMSVSSPAKPEMRSSPSRPEIVSRPLEPFRVSFAVVPVTMLPSVGTL